MQREGANHEDMRVSDFICDFCLREWDGTFAMVEGHQGSLICDRCLTVAYTETVLARAHSAPAGATCTLCLEERPDAMWQSPTREEACVCTRCLKQSAGRLHKDPDWAWTKPAAATE